VEIDFILVDQVLFQLILDLYFSFGTLIAIMTGFFTYLKYRKADTGVISIRILCSEVPLLFRYIVQSMLVMITGLYIVTVVYSLYM